jgi:hypothetical protein
MLDEQSVKFITLYETRANRAKIHEPTEIAELRYWPEMEIATTLRRCPDEFTPTFRDLYRRYRYDL